MQEKKRQKNKVIVLFIIIFIFGYFIFFSSSIWYPDNGNLVSATKISSEKTWNDRRVTLLAWDYSENQRMMEIKLEILNTTLDGMNTYTYEALERNGGYLDVKPVLETDDYIVLRIYAIDKNWDEISLRLKMPEEISDTQDALKLYTNSESVHRVASIEDLTAAEYQLARIDSHIKIYQADINELEATIEELTNTKLSQERDIAELKEKELYQTEEQIAESEQLISSAQAIIQNTETEISEAENKIAEYEERIKKANEEKKIYQNY